MNKGVEFDHLVNLIDELMEKKQGSLSEVIRSLFIAKKFLEELESHLGDVQDESVKRAIERLKKSLDKATQLIGDAYQSAVQELESDPEVQVELKRLFERAITQ